MKGKGVRRMDRLIINGGLSMALAYGATPSEAQLPIPRWNPKAPENAQLVPAINYPAVESVIQAIGARAERTGTATERPALLVTFANGRRAAISMSGCEPDGTKCRALSIQSTWKPIADLPAELITDAITQFNRRYAFAKAYLGADGKPSLQRYLIADYGFVRGNLALDLQAFADQAQHFVREVIQPLERQGKQAGAKPGPSPSPSKP